MKVKQKYREILETQKSGDMTNSGEIGHNIRPNQVPKLDRTSCRGVSVLCWYAAPIANVLWKLRVIR